MSMSCPAAIALTTVAVPISSTGGPKIVAHIQAKVGNTGILYVGDKTRQTFEITASNDRFFGPCGMTQLYVKTSRVTAGDYANVVLYEN